MTATIKFVLHLCAMVPIAVSATAGSVSADGSKESVRPVSAPNSTSNSERICPVADTSDANRSIIEAALARSEKNRSRKEEEEEEEQEERRLDCCP